MNPVILRSLFGGLQTKPRHVRAGRPAFASVITRLPGGAQRRTLAGVPPERTPNGISISKY